MAEVRCARCGRVADDESDEFLAWEAIDGGESVICEGCLTGDEREAILLDAEETLGEIARDEEFYVEGGGES